MEGKKESQRKGNRKKNVKLSRKDGRSEFNDGNRSSVRNSTSLILSIFIDVPVNV